MILCPWTEAMLTMLPARCASICGSTARAQCQAPSRSTEKHRAQSSSLKCSGSSKTLIPALLTSTSSRPKWLTACATMASTSARRPTSAARSRTSSRAPSDSAKACPAGVSSRTLTITRAPCSTNKAAVAAPMPCAPPVTRATLFSKRGFIVDSLLLATAFQLIDQNRRQQDAATHQILVEHIDIEQIHRVLHRAHDQHPAQHPADAGAATHQGHAAEHAGRNHVQLETDGRIRLSAGDARRQDHASERSHQALDQKDHDARAIHRNARQPGRIGIAAQRQGIAAIERLVQQHAKHQKTQRSDPDRAGNAEQNGVAQCKKSLRRRTDRLPPRS